jgi:tRNA nucleotidyltransferase (CCA-adding enzyme)
VIVDQLLGLPSHDLDVTLSSCAGYPFAQAFVNYLKTVPSASEIEIKSIGKVSANPDQSKHLETATTTILGLECDFVQLRSEVYADGSRIPSEVVRQLPKQPLIRSLCSYEQFQRIGTALEDAERRDITINTLFYNVHTRSVEDWTGKVRLHPSA